MANLYVNDGGDARLEDENGNVVARFDESVGEWQLNATNVSGVGAVDAQSVSAVESLSKNEPVHNVKHPDYGAVGDGSADDTQAIQDALNDASDGNPVYLPAGEYRVSSPLTWTYGNEIIGASMVTTTINGSDITSGPILSTDIDTRRTAPALRRIRLENGPDDGVVFDDTHEWTIARTWIEGCGGDGFVASAGTPSWKGVIRDSLANNNAAAGWNINGYAVSLHGVWALGNTIGVSMGGQADISAYTLEFNDTDLLIDSADSVHVGGGYHEASDVVWSPSDPKINIHVRNSEAVTISGASALKRRGVGIKVEDSDITLAAAGGESTVSGDLFGWHEDDNLGLKVSGNSLVRYESTVGAPIATDDISSISWSQDNTRGGPADELGGDGGFDVDGDGDGLADGWETIGSPTLNHISSPIEYGPAAQEVTSNSTFEGVRHSVSLSPSTNYTMGVWYRADGEFYAGTDQTERVGGFDLRPNAQVSDLGGLQFGWVQFSTGSTAPARLVIKLRDSGTTVVLDGMALYEGSYTASDFPML